MTAFLTYRLNRFLLKNFEGLGQFYEGLLAQGQTKDNYEDTDVPTKLYGQAIAALYRQAYKTRDDILAELARTDGALAQELGGIFEELGQGYNNK